MYQFGINLILILEVIFSVLSQRKIAFSDISGSEAPFVDFLPIYSQLLKTSFLLSFCTSPLLVLDKLLPLDELYFPSHNIIAKKVLLSAPMIISKEGILKNS